MLIDETKVHARFANACPNGAPADLISLMRNQLDNDRGQYLRQTVQGWKDQSYERSNELYNRIRNLKTAQATNAARAAELQRRLDSIDLASADPAETGKLLLDLAGCKHHIESLPDALAQAQAEDEKAKLQHSELSEMARIVDELTRRWTIMAPEKKAELLAEYLTDAERRRILENPEYLAMKAAEAEKARSAAEAAERAKERAAEWKAQAEAERAAERAPYERIDGLSKVELFAEAFEGAGPADIRQMLLSGDRRLRYMLAPQFSNAQGDALQTYRLNRMVFLVESGG